MGDNSDFASGYSLGRSEGSCNNGGGFGGMWGDGLWAIIILAMLGFGNGWGGGFGGFGGGGFVNGALTRAELYDGFTMQNIDSAVRGVQQGICDSTYALNNAINSGFYGVDRSICDIGHQISDCCCTTSRNIDSVRYDMATGFCNLSNTIQNTTRDIIDNQNANYRGIMDFMVQEKLAGQAAEIASLKGALGRAEDRSFLAANQEAQTAELIRRLGRDCPVPAYVVPNPNCCYGNPTGVGYGYNGNSGCGCGCGC